jgi:hypothetical protein
VLLLSDLIGIMDPFIGVTSYVPRFGDIQGWQEVMQANFRDVWQHEYSHLTKKGQAQQLNLTAFKVWRQRSKEQQDKGGEFEQYIHEMDGQGISILSLSVSLTSLHRPRSCLRPHRAPLTPYQAPRLVPHRTETA